MALQSTESLKRGMAIHELILEAYEEGKRDRRCEVRHPFFRPVSLAVGPTRHSAFSREISTGGIGLLHNMELSPGEVEITISSRRGHSVRLRTQIIWCRPCGEGWYISGGQFVNVVSVGE